MALRILLGELDGAEAELEVPITGATETSSGT
jgi:hypothetical protein